MRSNGKDMGLISRDWNSDFEAPILLKERNDSLFRKIVSFSSHYARLKGNLMVILKQNERSSIEAIGLIILENFQVDICQEKDTSHCFKIVFEADDPPIVFAAFSGRDRDLWLQHLHNASLLTMRDHLENVRNLIVSKTGQDPFETQATIEEAEPDEDQDTSGMELCFSCTNLPPVKKGSSKYPNYCIIAKLKGSNDDWYSIGKTEIESDQNPTFLKTIFVTSAQVSSNTLLCLTLVDISDVNTMRLKNIASLTAAMEELQNNASHEFRLSTADGQHFAVMCVGVTLRQMFENIYSQGETHTERLKTICDNVLSKSYAFPHTSLARLNVVEFLGESLFNTQTPAEYIKQVIQEDWLLYDALNTCSVSTDLEQAKKTRLSSARSSIMEYETALKSICDHPGVTFRPSSARRDPELEFMPINLHLHRTCVTSKTQKTVAESTFDAVTVGCFTDSPRRYKNGGLLRMIERHENILSDHSIVSQCYAQLKKCLHKKNRTENDLQSMIGRICGGGKQILCFERQQLQKRFSKFIASLKDVIFNDCVDTGVVQEVFDSLIDILTNLIDAGVERSLNEESMGLVTATRDILLTSIAEAWKTANDFLWGRILRRVAPIDADFNDITTRTHVVTAQALTAALTSLMAAVPQWSEAVWLQFSTCGIIVYFESLLSCYGDEKGMMEDMTVAVHQLSDFELHFYPSGVPSGPPHMTSLLTVRVPCPPAVWDRIPDEIRLRDRVVMRWYPIHFNVGINEQQTIADRRGRSAPQDSINQEGYKRLKHYFDLYCHHAGCPPRTYGKGDACDMLASIRHEINEVHSKKPVHILENVENIIFSLNGCHLVSCKSAKDRTAMSVTLKQVRWLIRHHGLPSDYLVTGINCLRSTGLRRENVVKNVGDRRYAFTKVQLMCFPKLYRPPAGTYGQVQT